MAAPKQARPAKGASSGTSRRTMLLGGFLALWVVGLTGRLYYLQVIDYVDFVARAQRQQQRTVEIAANRGTIFDREMHPLAMSVAVDSVYAVPSEIADRGLAAKVLASTLHLDSGELLARFDHLRSFCWVKRKVTDQEARRVRALNLRGIYFQKEMKRFYPKGELAAQVLGYVGMDDNGLAGIEFGMNKAIKGQPGRMLVVADARHQSFLSTDWKGEPGKNVVLTIDENIQYIAEKVLAETVTASHAVGGVAVVEDTRTGRILAMANYPTLDANDYTKSPPVDRIDRGVAFVFEPGSVFKLITVSSALEEGLTRPSEIIDCQMGRIEIGRHTIHDWKRFGALSVTDIIAHSSDVGAIKLGLRLGDDRFYQHIREYGFGEKTGIELPGEERGLLEPTTRWSGISIGAISIGQEVGVTPVQMLSTYEAIANGGVMIEPRILSDVFRGNEHDRLAPAPTHRVVSARTAEEMKQMLTDVVLYGTGQHARLNGYSAAGKSGTAQKIIAGRYSPSKYIASFIGFAPVDRPAIAILVSIDSPVGAHHGGEVAGPAFGSIAQQTLDYLDVPQDNPSQLPQIASSATAPSARQLRDDGASRLPSKSELPGSATSSSRSNSQPSIQPVSYTALSDTPGVPSSADHGTVVVDRGPPATVPDFSGLGMRRVADKCQELGLGLSTSGSGLAAEQNPPAGTVLPAGSTVAVRFARN